MLPATETNSNEQTISLKDELEIMEFHTSLKEDEFLMKIGAKNYYINEYMYKLIQLIDGSKTYHEIAEDYNKTTGSNYTEDNIKEIVDRFFVPSGIIKNLSAEAPHKRKKTYLRFRVPLVSGEFLEKFIWIFSPLFNKKVFSILNALIIIVHIYVLANFKAEKFVLLSKQSDLFVISSLIAFISVIFHELGHAAAAFKNKVKPGNIGFGFYLYFPVFYSDVSDIWQINRLKRTVVDYAGVYFQLLFNIILFIVYLFTGSIYYLFPIYFILLHSMSNLNPFFRFDGYWLMTDLLGIPNLRDKVNEIAIYFKKRFRNRSCTKPKILDNLPPILTKIFLTYAFISNLFFAYIIIRFVSYLPPIISVYPEYLFEISKNLPETFDLNSLKLFFGSLINLLTISIPIVFFLIICNRVMGGIIKFTKNLILK